MFIELVDAIRCVAPHEETWLVASVDRFSGRFIASGTLGCPICRASYPVRDGVLVMRDDPPPPPADDVYGRMVRPADDEVLRCAALLGLSEPGGVVLLGGAAGKMAAALEDAVAVTLLLVAPTNDIVLGPGTSAIRSGTSIPMAPGSVRGALFDEAAASPEALAGAARALATGGRLVAPAGAPLPAGVRELARDDREWVGVKEATPGPPVTLRRR